MPFFRKKTPDVSVLVPVYNTADYVGQCLDSLLGQTLRNMQIICIDDGSTDASPEILASYAARDSRIQVITKANSGYGASMNRGLDAAQGSYVGIVESDDFASPDMFKTYFKHARSHNLDLVKSNYFEHSDGQDVRVGAYDGFAYGTVFAPADNKEVLMVPPLIWSALYRRSMLEREKIRFLETPGASFQDTSFVHRVWFSAQRVSLIDEAFLHYRVDNSSSSVKSQAKVYEVMGEYTADEQFLRDRPERFAVFAPRLMRMKLDTYRWNYNRIALEHRRDFVLRWADEFRAAAAEGTLQQQEFDDYNWGIAQQLISDPEAFFEQYREAL